MTPFAWVGLERYVGKRIQPRKALVKSEATSYDYGYQKALTDVRRWMQRNAWKRKASR